jgi:hypothetical protein
MSAAVQAIAAQRWFRAQYKHLAPRFFQAFDPVDARGIGKCAFKLKSDTGFRVEEVDADAQPELIFCGLVVDLTEYVGAEARGTRRVKLYIPKLFEAAGE